MADNLNFKQGEYRNATPGLFSKGDIVLGRVPQPIYSEMGFANKSGCMPRAEVLCLRTEDSYSPNGRISCLSPIMPGPGVGFLIGTGMKARPIYGMTSFNTKMSNDGLILNMALHAHDGVTDSADSSSFGTAFINFDIGLIPAASATQTGVVTTGAQTFAGNKTFTGNILPQTDRAQNIGSLTQSFNAIYAKALYLKGTNSKANYIVGNNPTDVDYYAKLPNHSGNITISINGHFNPSGGGTYFIPFYSTKGEVIQYNNGLQYYTIEGTDTTTGSGMLILGNGTSTGSAGNKRGCLRIYGPNNIYTNIMAANLTTNRSVYIRDYGVATTYFVGVDNINGKGNETTPIYIADTGLATACDGVIITSGEQTFSGNKTFSDNLTIHSMNINSNSIYSTESEIYSLGTETSFFSNEYVNTLNIGQVENYISLKVDENIGILSSIYLPNITEDSRLLYAKKDIQLGSPTQPIYINNKGEAIASTENVGNNTIPMYLKDGVFSAMSNTIGAINQPVYFNKTNGFSPIECMAISYGGTGLTSFETNKLYRYDGEKLIDTAHVIEEDKIYTDSQSTANYLGSCYGDNKWIYFSGNRSNGYRALADSSYGDIINFTSNNIPKIHGIFCSHSTNYGTAEPTAASPVAEEGALYFKIIN